LSAVHVWATVLRRGIVAELPTAYLDFVPALSWPAFLLELESIVDDPSGSDEAARAARSAFNVFATEFNRLQGIDDLPKNAPNAAAALDALTQQVKIDGLFSDFPDVVVRYRAAH
jgi:hypothetical protein